MIACPVVPPYPAPAADRPRYALVLRLDPQRARVEGTERVTFTASRPTSRLVFRLWPNGPVQRDEGARLDVRSVSLPSTRPNPTTLVVRPKRPLARGASVTVRLAWTLRVPRRVRDRNSAFANGLRLGSFYPILAWDPRRGWVTDPPSVVVAETATSPVADYTMRISAPRGLTVVASGTPHGGGRWSARAVRDVAVAVGRFRIVTDVARAPNPVRVHVASTTDARRHLQLARESLESLARLYGPYPYPDYWLVVPPDLAAAGIEYPTLSYIGSFDYLAPLIRHETAHQWFYGLVGNDQARDPWLDEALASWAQRTRFPYPPPDRAAARHVGAPMSYWDDHALDYGPVVYGGGSSALRSLGPRDRVDCALRLYVARNAYRIARPRDLLDALDALIPGASKKLARVGIRR